MDFLKISDLSTPQLVKICARALEIKRDPSVIKQFPNQTLMLQFTEPSTRTRISMETSASLLGMHCFFLSGNDSQISRGESMQETAKIASSMVDLIAIRHTNHQEVQNYAAHSSCPVVSALTDLEHPCQILADWLTISEKFANTSDLKISWLGDWNNVANSWLEFSVALGLDFSLAVPQARKPALPDHLMSYFKDIDETIQGSHVVMTDTWVSMGDTISSTEIFEPFQVDIAMFNRAHKDAIFLHCLPAYQGKEMTAEVYHHERSAIWQQAENRKWATVALFELLLSQ